MKRIRGILPNDVSDARRMAEGFCSVLSNKDERRGCIKGVASLVNQLERLRPGLAGKRRR